MALLSATYSQFLTKASNPARKFRSVTPAQSIDLTRLGFHSGTWARWCQMIERMMDWTR